MNDLNLCCRIVTMVAVLLLLSMGTAFSGQSGDIGDVELYGDALQLDLKKSVKHATIKISGPDGFFYEEDLNKGAYIPLDWMEAAEDGYYKYEITAASKSQKKNTKMKMNNGRKYEPDMVNVREIQSGGFRIENGMIVNPSATEEE